jgi:hypothetical protein
MLTEDIDNEGIGDRLEFGIVIDEKGNVPMIVRTDFEDGTMEYRIDGEWTHITPDTEVPLLDEHPLTRVKPSAVSIWDRVEEEATEKDFEEVILDK